LAEDVLEEIVGRVLMHHLKEDPLGRFAGNENADSGIIILAFQTHSNI
jgi:hypothetical protein